LDTHEAELWDAYEANHTPETRNALVEHHSGLARGIAAKLWLRISNDAHLTEEDLHNEAVIGLVNLIDSGRFDRSRGLKFTTLAATRIRGHLLDCLRDHDWVPRHYRAAQKQGRHAETTLAFNSEQITALNVMDHREDATETLEKMDTLREVTTGCSQRERLIIIMYYYEHLTMSQIGIALAISESRVSQMMKSLLVRIRERMVT
jgi:RNA polymerase sigma factor FliA